MSRLLYSIPVEKTKESSFCIKSESGLDGLLAPVFFFNRKDSYMHSTGFSRQSKNFFFRCNYFWNNRIIARKIRGRKTAIGITMQEVIVGRFIWLVVSPVHKLRSSITLNMCNTPNAGHSFFDHIQGLQRIGSVMTWNKWIVYRF